MDKTTQEELERKAYREKTKILDSAYMFNFSWLSSKINFIGQPGIVVFVDALEDIKDTSAAIIVGAGPSLDKDLPILKERKDDVIIIATDASVPILKKNDIIPHVVMVCDASENQHKNFLGFEDLISKTYTFMATIVHPVTFDEARRSKAKICWFNYADDGSETCINICLMSGGRKGALIPGVLTSGMAMQAAIWLGIRKIAFIGQDLCYYDLEKGYALDISEEKSNFQKKVKFNDLIEFEDVNGKTVLTHETFKAFYFWMNDVSQGIWDGIDFYNCSGCGILYGPQIKQIPLEEFINLHSRKGTGIVAKNIMNNVWKKNIECREIGIGPVRKDVEGEQK